MRKKCEWLRASNGENFICIRHLAIFEPSRDKTTPPDNCADVKSVKQNKKLVAKPRQK